VAASCVNEQARIQQLEGSLLQQLAESSRESLQQAEAASIGAQLDALLTPELLAASQPTGSSNGSSAGGSLLVEASCSNQVQWQQDC